MYVLMYHIQTRETNTYLVAADVRTGGAHAFRTKRQAISSLKRSYFAVSHNQTGLVLRDANVNPRLVYVDDVQDLKHRFLNTDKKKVQMVSVSGGFIGGQEVGYLCRGKQYKAAYDNGIKVSVLPTSPWDFALHVGLFPRQGVDKYTAQQNRHDFYRMVGCWIEDKKRRRYERKESRKWLRERKRYALSLRKRGIDPNEVMEPGWDRLQDRMKMQMGVMW